MSTLIEEFIFNNTRTSHKRWESMVMYSLHYSLRDVELLSQFSAGPYLIDGYFPDLNLAIEIDEPYHQRTKELDAIREAEIKEILGCEFFRIDVQESVYEQVDKLITLVRERNPKQWIIPQKIRTESDGEYSKEHLSKLNDANAFEFIRGLREDIEEAGIHTESGDSQHSAKPSNGMLGFLACFDGLKLTVFIRASCKPKIIVQSYDTTIIEKLGIILSDRKNPKLPYWNIIGMEKPLSREETILFLKEISRKLNSFK
ncbi:hypothetical protein C9J12_28455 [Photobacterium frigidiphilum]|uniref:Restriction endonuclease PvuRts1 I-like N-terminal domain-containing protein n=1 Tax=Photobacterium frigidiphilum TaxID=264736 RepID=A0A2T3J6E8_9GAMM|nr:hypothetical protein [Photobacterium frigidiphilum]PSU43043.1 hypothetical protein C9J12_28455 [Photobacterium frigidiphilum]